MAIRDVLLATEEARKAYQGKDRPSTPWYHMAVKMVEQAETQGRDPWEAVREVLLRMHKTIAQSIEREVQRRMQDPSLGALRDTVVGYGRLEDELRARISEQAQMIAVLGYENEQLKKNRPSGAGLTTI